MKKPKTVNPTYVGDGIRKICGTYTSPTGVVHGVEMDEEEYTYDLCNSAWDRWDTDIPYKKSGKAKDITCKHCLRLL